MERISPTGDLGFKKVLASEENKDILSGFITDFFTVIPEELTIHNPYSIDICREFTKNGTDINVLRQTLRDITASFKTGDFIAELQVRKTRHFDKRMIYYPLRRFCDNYNIPDRVETGEDGRLNRYSSLRTVYSLAVLGYNHYPDDGDALRILELYDPVRRKHGSDLLKIGVFELKKPNIETVNQKHWRDYFLTGIVPPEAPDYIKRASQIIDKANLGEEEMKVEQTLEKAQAILDAEHCGAYFDGEEEGRLEGIISMIKNLIKKGMILEDAAETADLPVDVVKAHL